MKLKIDEATGQVVVKDGHPVYVYEDGKEAPFNAKETLDSYTKRMANLEDEKNRHFKTAEKLEQKLKTYEGIDPAKYQEYSKVVQNLNDQQILDQKGIEALKKSMLENFNEEKKADQMRYENAFKETEAEKAVMKKLVYDLAITNKFATSEWFGGSKPKTIYPPEDAAMIFGRHFDVDIDKSGKFKIVAKDDSGQVIMSKVNHGEQAGFDEALALLVENHAKKHAILRSTGPGGPQAVGNILLPDGKNLENLTPEERIKVGLQQRYKGHFGR